MIAGGRFNDYEGVPVPNFIAGLDADGRLNDFTPGANLSVYATALESTGMLLVGGDFTYLGRGGRGQDYRRRIGRVSNTALATQELSVNETASAITWMRGGTSPEVYRTTFESSLDGVSYVPLGNGERIAGGWRLAGLALPVQHRYIRGRGFYLTGQTNGSGSITETILDRQATAMVSGRVLTPAGLGLRSALVYLTDAHGVRRVATTSSFGHFSFPNVPTAESYSLSVASKRFRFAPQSILVSGNMSDIVLSGLE
jgi:hypothetical protein